MPSSDRIDEGAFSAAFRSGTLWGATVALAASVGIAVVVFVEQQEPLAPVAIVLFVALWLVVFVAHRVRRVPVAVTALVAGTVLVAGATVVILTWQQGFRNTNSLAIAMPAVALMFVSGPGGMAAALAWPTAGFVAGTAASYVAAAVTGFTASLNIAALGAFLLVLGFRAAEWAVRARVGALRGLPATVTPPGTEAAATVAAVAAGHLHALAESGSGPLDPRMRAEIRRDLARFVGHDWRALTGVPITPPGGTRAVSDASASGRRYRDGAPAGPSLPQLAASASSVGVLIRRTGDPALLTRLAAPTRDAVDAALAQCVVNVARHAGVHEAALALREHGGEVEAVFSDRGAGFDAGRIGSDRVGLRISVRARIEAVGGTVDIRSAEGEGTTITIRLPMGEA